MWNLGPREEADLDTDMVRKVAAIIEVIDEKYEGEDKIDEEERIIKDA